MRPIDEYHVAWLGGRSDVRLIHATVAEAARRDLLDDACEWRALLLERHWVVHMLVAEVPHRRREVAEEDCREA